jgi:carotenoid phi-ring synthase / carotenoid chi-ring synthase
MSWTREVVPQHAAGHRERLGAQEQVRAVVVGGGIAGIAAATILAEKGARVTLLERESYLGGRAGAWSDRLASGEPFEMERGFHAFFRQYYNLRGLLRRVDPQLAALTPLADYPLLGPDGAAESFADLPRLAPFNVLELIRRTPRLRLLDLMRVHKRAALEMFTYDAARTYRRYDATTAAAFLDSLRFPPDARQMLFDVFAHSFFNPEAAMSAGDLLMMFHFYFTGNPEGLVFDVLDEPFSLALWAPFQRYLQGLGVRILTGTEARRVTAGAAGWQVELGDGQAALDAELVVLAVNVPALRPIVAASPALGDPAWRRSVEGLDVTLPFAVWRLWLDRPARADRSPFAGTTGLGLLDNISLYERFEGESRRYALRTGGSVVELHAYAVPEGVSEAEIRRDLRQHLGEVYPELREARVVEERYLLRRDCPAFPPGRHLLRPTVETPSPGVALAGDFVRLPFPTALMECAAASGIRAANHLLSRWAITPTELWSVPRRGMLARFCS